MTRPTVRPRLALAAALLVGLVTFALAGGLDDFGGAQGTATGGGSGDLTAVTETGDALTVTNGTGPIPDLAAHANVEGLADAGTMVAGDLFYATSSTAIARLAKGTADQTLRMNAGATAPEWDTVAAGGWDGTTSVAMTGSISLTGDGAQMSEGLRRRVYTYTGGSGAPTTLSAAQIGSVITNEGTTVLAYNALPTAVAGYRYTFVVQDADGMRVTAASGDTIRYISAVTSTAGYVESTTIGTVWVLESINATEWVVTQLEGSLTVGA